MKHSFLRTCLALVLVFALSFVTLAQALTPDRLKELLEQYYLEPIPEEAQTAETVEEIIAALHDPYTAYLTAEELTAFLSSMEDAALVGIGVSGLLTDEGMEIKLVYEGSPAAKLGLVPGDTIIRVGNQTAAGKTAEEISSWLRGEAGTTVTFSVSHADGTEQSYTAVRAEVVIATTQTKLLENGTTGYIICNAFGSGTLSHVLEGMKANKEANLWVVDLRTNGGGDVYSVTQTLGAFLGAGTSCYLRNGKNEYSRYVSEQERATIYPTIVLTSGATASSAEIFALAVKDRQGGMLIGSHTYGKGVAQVILTGKNEPQAFPDGDALRVTSYQYYGVGGNTAHRIGVLPDLLVDAEDADEIAGLFSPQEPLSDKRGYLQINLGTWRFYVEERQAKAADTAPYFAKMLSALPPACDIFAGTADGWTSTTAKAVAKRLDVAGYAPRVFSDVGGTDCEQAANTLRTYEMLMGYADGTFRPNETLTRAELCALLVQTMRLPMPKNGAEFSDVVADSWYAPYIRASVAAGYLQGVGGGRFAPNAIVTNEELITVLGRLAAALNMNFHQASTQVPAETGVPVAYSAWAESGAWLLACSQKNMLGQTISMLNAPLEELPPTEATTRGDVAQILYTILTAVGLLTY